ncbi:iron-sulfur cluster assembly protein [Plantactinospora sp. GCM10030261]|uniref:iron-sulfur cluster assembly protein n=1 Tax=Plantactinospora sp. GCM10030261 TaxID=3273420 RepID=UPI00361C34C2
MSTEWVNRVEAVLADVVDPCSCMASAPVNIVELGLVTKVTVDDTVDVTLTLTDPMCMYFIDMAEEIERRVAEAGWAGEVRVRYDADGDWTPDRMSPAAQRRLGDHRARRARLLRITPYRYPTLKEVES